MVKEEKKEKAEYDKDSSGFCICKRCQKLAIMCTCEDRENDRPSNRF